MTKKKETAVTGGDDGSVVIDYDPRVEAENAQERIFGDDSAVTILKPPIAVDKDFPKR